MKTVIVLPTYNEKENIELLIPRLESAFREIKKFEIQILVVDDKSPDNTAHSVKKLMKKYKNLHLLSGDKKGLGEAYLRGFDYAITKLGAEILMMMDADLQHPPELVPKFMKEIDNGYDFVIGSRYVKGGDAPDFSLLRKLISAGGNFFARIVSGMYNVHDCTSGFRAFKVSKFNQIDRKSLHTKGYAFMSTVLFEMISVGSKVKEIPFVFRDRTHGNSKLNKRDLMEFFFNAFRLRFKSMKILLKFAAVGISGIAVNMGFLWVFTEFAGLNYKISSPFAVELSIIWNFFLNNYWTFIGTKNKSGFFKRIGKFHLTAMLGFAINYFILVLLTEKFAVHYLISNLIGIFIAFFWNYFINVKWTWRE